MSASNAAGTSTTTIEILIPVDRDANGLIELYTLTQLHNMRYNLSGSSYKTSTADTGSTTGCPNAACNGYELMNDVEFDTDGDGQSWTQDSSGNYSLDSGDSAAPYFVIDSSGSGGWQPVGDSVRIMLSMPFLTAMAMSFAIWQSEVSLPTLAYLASLPLMLSFAM